MPRPSDQLVIDTVRLVGGNRPAARLLQEQGWDISETSIRRMFGRMQGDEPQPFTVELPGGGFYLWAQAPGGDAWALARVLAEEAGVIVAPGEFYGSRTDHVRFAAVQPTDDLRLAASRLGAT